MTVCSCLCSLLEPENFVWSCHYNPDEDIRFMAFQPTSGESRSSGDECADLRMVCQTESPEGFIIKCHIVSTVSPVECCQILVVLVSSLLPSKKLLLSFLCYCILILRVSSMQDQFNVVSSLSVEKRLDFQHTHPIPFLGRARMPPAGFSCIYLYSTGNFSPMLVWLKHDITLDLSQN